MDTKKTVGSIIQQNAALLSPFEFAAPQELTDDFHKAHYDGLIECAKEGLKTFDKDFFIVILMKHEKVLGDVIRMYPIIRSTCPTPDYDQTVYRVIYKTQDIQYIWTIPDRESCIGLLQCKEDVPREYHHILQYVMDFESGELYKLSKKLNNEVNDLDVVFEVKKEE